MPNPSDQEVYTLDDGRRLCCSVTVRLLPGKRKVCEGALDGEPVFAKLYLDPGRGEKHWQREVEGIRAFQERGILSPRLLYAGTVGEDGWPAILLAALSDHRSLKDLLAEADPESSEYWLKEMAALLAEHHRAGIEQTDLHLGNFVISQNRLYSLDGAGVRTVTGELDRELSLNNFALFLSQLPPSWNPKMPGLFERYAETRGWALPAGISDLEQRVGRARDRRWVKFREKLFRECTAFRYSRAGSRTEIVSRPYLSPELEALLRDPDNCLQQAIKILKRGNTSTVWSADAGDLHLVVKRYNVKNFWHGIKLNLRRGRAFCSWENAHRLLFHDILTPRPVALLEVRRNRLHPVAYLLTEYVDGVGSHQWFLDATTTPEAKADVAGRIARLFRQLQTQRISHGDLKASNILVVGREAMLIDLDSMRGYETEKGFRNPWQRDLRRFMANWQGLPELAKLFESALEQEGIKLPPG
jgi:tRNA A-37 threonylcarbamoyl transferase component Bud32